MVVRVGAALQPRFACCLALAVSVLLLAGLPARSSAQSQAGERTSVQGEAYDDSDFPDIARLSQRPGPAPLELWRDVASQLSFDFRVQGLRPGLTLPVSGRLYLPFRQNRLIGGGLFIKERGYGSAHLAARARLEALERATPAPLKSLVHRAAKLSEARTRLAIAHQRWGNSADASLRQGVGILADLGSRWLALEEAERQDELDDVEISEETLERLNDVLAGLRKHLRPGALYESLTQRPQDNGLPAPSQFTWFLSHADIELAEKSAALWRSDLLPLVAAAAGPVSPSGVLTPTVLWSDERTAFSPLQGVAVRNVGESTLTNVVVELRLHNGWEERTTYYFVPSWPRSRTVTIYPHARHVFQREWTVRARLSGRYWADESSGTLPAVESTSPNPRTDAAEIQRTAATFEQTLRTQIRLWGAIAQLLAARN
jgi:hypothetical protein